MRPQANIVVNTAHGMMIVNRNDYHMLDDKHGYGVGFQLLNTGEYDMQEINFAKFCLQQRLNDYGKGVVAIDCGANIGVHTIEWAKTLHNVGAVISFEAQDMVYYQLCGNIAINNCFNVTAYNSAVGDKNCIIDIPKPDYMKPSTYGSMELKQKEGSENIGQKLDRMVKVEQVALDDLPVRRVDFLKIDVEGMEFDVLAGAQKLIEKHKPQMLIEVIKIDQDKMRSWLEDWGYNIYTFGGNFFAVHKSDMMASKCSTDENGSIRIG